MAGGEIDLAAEALAEEGVSEILQEDSAVVGGVGDGGGGEGGGAGVGPHEARHVEAAGFFGHEFGVGEGPCVVAIAGLDAVGLDGADGDEDDVGLFEGLGDLDLGEAGKVAGVEFADLGGEGCEQREQND